MKRTLLGTIVAIHRAVRDRYVPEDLSNSKDQGQMIELATLSLRNIAGGSADGPKQTWNAA